MKKFLFFFPSFLLLFGLTIWGQPVFACTVTVGGPAGTCAETTCPGATVPLPYAPAQITATQQTNLNNQCNTELELSTTVNWKCCAEAQSIAPLTPCVTEHPTYSCIDKGTRTDCIPGKCPGTGSTIQCCPPAAGGTNPPAGNGDTKGGGGGDSVTVSPDDLSPVGDVKVQTLIGTIVKGALGITGSLALLMFVYGGFLMMISQGDATKVTKGKTAMIWASVGIIVIFGSYIFVSYIIEGLNVGT